MVVLRLELGGGILSPPLDGSAAEACPNVSQQPLGAQHIGTSASALASDYDKEIVQDNCRRGRVLGKTLILGKWLFRKLLHLLVKAA
jgi:hypothetical protein